MSVVVGERYDAEATSARSGSRFYKSQGGRGDEKKEGSAHDALHELMSLEISLA